MLNIFFNFVFIFILLFLFSHVLFSHFLGAFDVVCRHKRMIIGRFNQILHGSTPWLGGRRGCLGFYVDVRVVKFFHFYKLAPSDSDQIFVARSKAEAQPLVAAFWDRLYEKK